MSKHHDTIKQCTRCKVEYPATLEFFFKKRNYLSSYCKNCQREIGKKWREENKERQSKSIHEWHLNHKERRLEQSRQYRRTNKERQNESGRKYYHSHKHIKKAWRDNNPDKIDIYRENRRSRELNLPNNFTGRQWTACKLFFNYQCVYCGKHAKKLHIDHLIPLASPTCPGTIVTNILPACKSCNSSKGDSQMQTWLYSRVTQNTYERICQAIDTYIKSCDFII